MHRLMVYGTLKSGHGNNVRLQGSKFLGPAKTLPCFTMFDCGIPMVIPDGETAIVGEVYEVDDLTLRSCDSLEGHPDWYKRIEVETNFGKAWMYCMNPEYIRKDMVVVQSGEWRR